MSAFRDNLSLYFRNFKKNSFETLYFWRTSSLLFSYVGLTED